MTPYRTWKDSPMPSPEFCMQTSNGGANTEEIRGFERRNALELPQDYVRFLAQHNGGKPQKPKFTFDDEDATPTSSRISRLHGIDCQEPDLERTFRFFASQNRIPPNHLPVATDPFGNMLLMSLCPETRGEIRFWDHEREHLGPDHPLPLVAFEGLFEILKSEE
jgi:hypothetical protein